MEVESVKRPADDEEVVSEACNDDRNEENAGSKAADEREVVDIVVAAAIASVSANIQEHSHTAGNYSPTLLLELVRLSGNTIGDADSDTRRG